MAITDVWPFIALAQNYTILYDYDASSNLIYTGWSQPGLGITERGWRIMYQTFNSGNKVTGVFWPNDSTAFDFVWADRTSYSYGFGGTTYPAIILISPDATRWAVTVTITGNLSTDVSPSGPTDAYDTSPVVLEDELGNAWTLTIQDTGNLVTTLGGTDALTHISLVDADGVIWELTINSSGNLITTEA